MEKIDINIVDVISQYIKLDKKGVNYTGLCPFHQEKTSSFIVSPSKQIYTCFGCGATGDVISFLINHKGYNYIEACKELDIDVKDNTLVKDDVINRKALEMFLSNRDKKEAEKIMEGVKKRFPIEMIDKFKIGVSLDSWDQFLKILDKKEINKALEIGLISESKGKKFDFFRNGIVFPLIDEYGYNVGFGQKNLSSDVKYMNSKESELFNKDKFLYGLNVSKNAIRKNDNVNIVEGYADVIKMHSIGIENTIGGCGTALTDNQIKIIKKYTKNVTLIYDGDDAGEKATIKNGLSLLKHDLNVKVIILENDEDPDSYFNDIESYINIEKQDFIKYYAAYIYNKCKDDTEKIDGIVKIKEMLSFISDEIKREIYTSSIAKEHKIKVSLLSQKGKPQETDEDDNDDDELKKYMRIGDTYYKIITQVTSKNSKYQKLVKRSRQTIIDDFNKYTVEGDKIPKYDQFCNVPDNINHQKIIDNCYNLYNEVKHEAIEGDFPTINMFFKHIFGNETITDKENKIKSYDLGYDYIQILYLEPTQILPILCLISKENETGKTTFAEFLQMIFGMNATIIGQNELNTEFNSTYATKLVTSIDESYINYKVIDKLKQMATSPTIQLRMMHRDHQSIDFFGKFLLLSNREHNFIKIDQNDIRYWVRKLPKIQEFDSTFKDKLKSEIPAFLYFLQNRKLVTKRESRHHFRNDLLFTKELVNLRVESMSDLCKDMLYILMDDFENKEINEDYIKFTPKDVKDKYFRNNQQITISSIRNVLKNELQLKAHEQPERYNFLDDSFSRVGRYYTLDRDAVVELLNESKGEIKKDDNKVEDDLPF